MNQVLKKKEEEMAISMIDEMEQMDISSEEFEKASKAFVEIRKIINDADKIEGDLDMRADQIENDKLKIEGELELAQSRLEMESSHNESSLCIMSKSNRSDTVIKGVGIGVTLATELIKLGAFGRFYHQGMEYERTDSYSTLATKGLAQSVSKIFRF